MCPLWTGRFRSDETGSRMSDVADAPVMRELTIRGSREHAFVTFTEQIGQWWPNAFSAANPEKFFTTDHYQGFPAVLVRLDKVDARERRELLTETWRCEAPRTMVKEFDASR